MKNTFILVILGVVTLVTLCYAMVQGREDMTLSTAMESYANADLNADTGVTTSMSGNTSTTTGVPISSTSASRESRSTSGSEN